ncbi:hypothetical protein [Actinoplanes cyaneus]|nr:hypothetical protein [Actinoplanes cyaneus]
MMTLKSKWATRVAATTVLALAGVLPAVSAQAATETTAAAATPVTVNYGCYVTFPGGETTVPYALTFTTSAPATVAKGQFFKVTLDTPAITPNPAIQSQVQDVAVRFKLPTGAVPVAWWLTGGTVSGASVERQGDVLVLKAAGPFPAATVFDLPELDVLLLSKVKTGVLTTATGGTGTDNPSFSWTRTSASAGDPAGTLRPFRCEPAATVTLTSTTATK